MQQKASTGHEGMKAAQKGWGDERVSNRYKRHHLKCNASNYRIVLSRRRRAARTEALAAKRQEAE